MTEADRLRASYEGILKNNPSNIEGVHYLAIWHLERQSFQQVILILKIRFQKCGFHFKINVLVTFTLGA